MPGVRCMSPKRGYLLWELGRRLCVGSSVFSVNTVYSGQTFPRAAVLPLPRADFCESVSVGVLRFRLVVTLSRSRNEKNELV